MVPTVEQESKLDSASDGTNGTAANFEYPKWLTAELFEKHLKETVSNFRQIKSFEVKPAMADGENFATLMVRIKIDVELADGTTKLYSYMMKIPHESGFFQQMMENHNIFKVEYEMYDKVVPEFEQLYRENGLDVNISPRCYNIETPTEFGVILLEDLGPQGYKNANRLEGFDMEQTKAALERLAQWHAASAVRAETKGIYPESLFKGMFHESQRETMTNFHEVIGKNTTICIQSIEGHEEYFENLVKSLETTLEDLFRTTKYDPNEFNVLNHGDCWSNNIMFKYDSEGNIADALLIDYQMANYGSPAKDLYYFLLSSTNYDLKVNRFDYFIKYYHDNLIKNLKLLNYPKKLPTLKDIHMAMIKYSVWGLITIFSLLSVALIESNNGANGLFEGNSETRDRVAKALYTNPRYRKHLQVILPWMSNRGFFVST